VVTQSKKRESLADCNRLTGKFTAVTLREFRVQRFPILLV
jgi:hypothetical protein